MQKHNILTENHLFRNISATEIVTILNCMGSRTLSYKKGEIIYHTGTLIKSIGIVLSGCVHIIKYDLWGNANIIQEIVAGESFAEVYACQNQQASLVDVVTVKDSEILFIEADKILRVCSSCCHFHQTLVENLLYIVSEKNLNLMKKLEHTSPKTIRDRILSYLATQAQTQAKRSFDIPFNRQQLADYLLVDRSALSAELSKMKKHGLIEYKKNHFIINRLIN